jgi:hypothetical protein
MGELPNAQALASIETSTRHKFFIKRLKELGMYDENSDYNGMIGRAVEELSATFAGQGHSGMSAGITLALFMKLMDEYQNPEPVVAPV